MAFEIQPPSTLKKMQLPVGALVLAMGSAQTAMLVERASATASQGGRAWFGVLAILSGGLGFIHRSPFGVPAKWVTTAAAMLIPWLLFLTFGKH